MPDRDQCIPPPDHNPEETWIPQKTRDEIVAQRLIRCAAGKLRQIANPLSHSESDAHVYPAAAELVPGGGR